VTVVVVNALLNSENMGGEEVEEMVKHVTAAVMKGG